MKAKDKVKEIIENIKGKKEDKTTVEKTNTINIGPSISSIEAIMNEQDFNKRMDMYRAAHYNVGMMIAAEEGRKHSPITNGQTMEESIEKFEQDLHESYLSECNELAEMDDNDRIDYYNKHGFNVAKMAQYESTVNEIIEKNQEEADKILQDEQAAQDDYDYMRIIEMDQAEIPSDFENNDDGMEQ